jgi:hypothetical protein
MDRDDHRAMTAPQMLTASDVREMLRRECEKAGGQTAWGRLHDISVQQVNNVLRGGDSPGGSVARALKLRRNPYTWSLDNGDEHA